jgi:hypothetical protein
MEMPSKILNLINLLYHRKQVRMETITEVCGISERTAYRYLDIISAANIPVYYDRNLKAYCINKAECICFGGLDIIDSIMIILALNLLTPRVNDYHKKLIQRLIRRMLTHNKHRLESLLAVFDENIREVERSEDIDVLISNMIIEASILFDKKLRLKVRQGDEMVNMSIEKPSLRFDRDWLVTENFQSDGISIPISKILGARLRN